MSWSQQKQPKQESPPIDYTTFGLSRASLPLEIENHYLLRADLVMRICGIIFFSLLIWILWEPRFDSLDELFRRIALGSAIVLFIRLLFFLRPQMFFSLLKTTPCITLDPEKITYEYVRKDGSWATYTLPYAAIKKASWSFQPHAILLREVWYSEFKKADDRHKQWVQLPLFIVPLSLFLLYLLLNRKLERYLLLRFEEGILAIPVQEGISLEGVRFEWNSLIHQIHFIRGGCLYFGD